MYRQTRYLTKEDREKIKEAREKERNYFGYKARAVENMTPKPCNRKLKETLD